MWVTLDFIDWKNDKENFLGLIICDYRAALKPQNRKKSRRAVALLDIFITERGNYLIVGRGEEEGGAEGGRGGEGGRKRGWEGRRGGGEKVVNFELSSVKWACFTYTLQLLIISFLDLRLYLWGFLFLWKPVVYLKNFFFENQWVL